MYKVISEDTVADQIKHSNENAVVYSLFNQLECPIQSDIFSVKFAVEGIERYTVNGVEHVVPANNYLLVNGQSEGKVLIDDNATVKGLCVNITPQIIQEVVASFINPDTDYVDIQKAVFFSEENFSKSIVSYESTLLGVSLYEIGKMITDKSFNTKHFTQEWFFNFAEKLVLDQQPLFKQLHTIPSIKNSTKKILLKRVFTAKSYIDAYFMKQLTIAEIAKEVSMSEYHFSRIFRTIVGVSPYQYILSQRLKYAKELLHAKKMNISEISIHIGFTDIYSFSRAFKREFGVSPSNY